MIHDFRFTFQKRKKKPFNCQHEVIETQQKVQGASFDTEYATQ